MRSLVLGRSTFDKVVEAEAMTEAASVIMGETSRQTPIAVFGHKPFMYNGYPMDVENEKWVCTGYDIDCGIKLVILCCSDMPTNRSINRILYINYFSGEIVPHEVAVRKTSYVNYDIANDIRDLVQYAVDNGVIHESYASMCK